MMIEIICLVVVSLVGRCLSSSAGIDTDVQHRKLVNEKITSSQILNNYRRYCRPCLDIKHFPGFSMGFSTPSNIDGYLRSKNFVKKVDSFVSGSYKIMLWANNTIQLVTDEDIDPKWMEEMRKIRPESSITAVITIEQRGNSSIKDKKIQNAIIQTVVDLSNKHNFNSTLFSLLFERTDNQVESNSMIIEMARRLHKVNKKIFMAIPFGESNDQNQFLFDKQAFDLVKNHIDAFILIPYNAQLYFDQSWARQR